MRPNTHLRSLLTDRHHEEALLATAKGDVDGGEVLAAIERDLQLGLHLPAVGSTALRDALPGAPPDSTTWSSRARCTTPTSSRSTTSRSR